MLKIGSVGRSLLAMWWTWFPTSSKPKTLLYQATAALQSVTETATWLKTRLGVWVWTG